MILEKIAADTRLRLKREMQEIPLTRMKQAALSLPSDPYFPFERMLEGEGIHFICEVKKASPSKGLIAPDFPYLEIAKEYEAAGAGAISCLTEPHFFLGKKEYLKEIAAQVQIPVLRKDFTINPYQIYEAKVLGASAILLICALLDANTIKEYLQLCDSLGLSALVEVHDAQEMNSAITAGARVIGVNNRNLQDFTVDIKNSTRLRPLAPKNTLFVAESGIRTAKDIRILKEAKVNGVLIGEALMRSPDKKAMLTALNGGPL